MDLAPSHHRHSPTLGATPRAHEISNVSVSPEDQKQTAQCMGKVKRSNQQEDTSARRMVVVLISDIKRTQALLVDQVAAAKSGESMTSISTSTFRPSAISQLG